MRKILPVILVLCLMFSGCAEILDGSYYYTQPHEAQPDRPENLKVNAQNYDQLYQALEDIVEAGIQSQLISVDGYMGNAVSADMRKAVLMVTKNNPIAAYAVDDIAYELGSSSGQSAVAVSVSYLHDRTQIRKIKSLRDMKAVQRAIISALDNCEASLVLYVQNYEETDFLQIVEDYSASSPDMVMEVPQVSDSLYPSTGAKRVIELKFTYQNSRDDLRMMQEQVKPLFSAAELYVRGDGAQEEKFTQLYSFLTERFDTYEVETSITPAYSLLRHGVGDAKAFAIVYAAMCIESGLECQVVAGTRWGEPWTWNLVCVDGNYYHVDLVRCIQEGAFQLRWDALMEGYVWDFSGYPESLPPEPVVPDPSEPETTAPETQPPTQSAPEAE